MTGQTTSILKIGFVGSGFIADFHLKSLVSVRNVEVIGVYSPNKSNRSAFAAKVRESALGDCIAYDSLDELVRAPDLDAIWVLSPNNTRIEVMNTVVSAVKSGESSVYAIACEKPLARTLKEAREVFSAVNDGGLLHGYLENQVFAPPVTQGKEVIWRRAVPSAGRPYLARAAEEHSGPHMPWFWDGEAQGGGALSDMMCHSAEVTRYLLTGPDDNRDSLKLISANATVANLKWTRPKYAEQLRESMGLKFDFRKRPVEDFARGVLEFEDPDGNIVLGEAATSWSYVGAGLRISLELQGPEYAMQVDTLSPRLQVFLSRNVTGSEGEDMVEKQNAEQGVMPIVEEEASVYGYVGENRHMVEKFLAKEMPDENFEDGVNVVEMLMALYKSAETGRKILLADEDLTDFVPSVAKRQ